MNEVLYEYLQKIRVKTQKSAVWCAICPESWLAKKKTLRVQILKEIRYVLQLRLREAIDVY